MATDLTGRVAIVTGSGAGLGLAIAEELAKAGASIAVAEIDPEAAESAAERLSGLGARAQAYQTDVSKASDVDRTWDAAAADFGHIDVVVNNAGISRIGPHTDAVSDADWLDSLAVMQTGVFYGMRAAARHMLPRRTGSIVNISSIRGFSPNPGRIAYSSPKAAVIMMTRTAAGEWADRGVRVNAVAPGVMRTPMWDTDVSRGAIDEQHYLDLIPAGRLGRPDEVGKLVCYLCSDVAEYITGSCITIDGGLTSIPAG